MDDTITLEGVKNYVELIKLIDNLERPNRRTFEGFIAKPNRDLANLILKKLEDIIPPHSQIFPNFDEEDGAIELKLPHFYALSLAEMLQDYPASRNHLISQPTYFEDLDYIYQPTDINNIDSINNLVIKNYIKCVNLFLLIKTQTDHHILNNLNEETLYFLGKKKLRIINNLTAIDEELNLDSILAFKTAYIDSPIHKEAIKQIIKDSFINYYSTLQEVSINQVCKDFKNIYDVIKNNYETYISEFTFSKIKRDVDKFRTESIVRINKALSDIQMQIVTIPASVVIVSANFKTARDFSILTNSIILFGAIFFAIAVYYICENQKDTLKNIFHEVQSHEKELRKDPLFLQDTDISQNYIFIYNRYRKQRKNLTKIKIGVALSIIITIIIYFVINAEYSCLTYHVWLLSKFYC